MGDIGRVYVFIATASSVVGVTGYGVAKVLDYNMVYSQGLPNDIKVG